MQNLQFRALFPLAVVLTVSWLVALSASAGDLYWVYTDPSNGAEVMTSDLDGSNISLVVSIPDTSALGTSTAEDIDRAIRGSIGFRLAAIGPLLVYDFAGIDINSRVYKHLVQDIRSDRDVHGIIEKLVADGHLGVKTGQGLYDYTPESVEQLHAMRDRRFLELIKLFYSR